MTSVPSGFVEKSAGGRHCKLVIMNPGDEYYRSVQLDFVVRVVIGIRLVWLGMCVAL